MSIDINITEGPLLPCGGGGPSLSEVLEVQAGMDADEWRRVSDLAQVVANYLVCHPRVAEVRYPGLTGDPSYHEASCTLRGGFGPEIRVRLSGQGAWLRYLAEDGLAAEQVLTLEKAICDVPRP